MFLWTSFVFDLFNERNLLVDDTVHPTFDDVYMHTHKYDQHCYQLPIPPSEVITMVDRTQRAASRENLYVFGVSTS